MIIHGDSTQYACVSPVSGDQVAAFNGLLLVLFRPLIPSEPTVISGRATSHEYFGNGYLNSDFWTI